MGERGGGGKLEVVLDVVESNDGKLDGELLREREGAAVGESVAKQWRDSEKDLLSDSLGCEESGE